MNKIELSENEIAVIDKYLKGEISMFGTGDEDMETMKGVINKAETLQDELDAYEESGEDLIIWFWEKYQAQ